MTWENVLKKATIDGYHIDEIISDELYDWEAFPSHWYYEAAAEQYINTLTKEFSKSGEELTKESLAKWFKENFDSKELHRIAREYRDDDSGPAYEDFGPVEGYKNYY